MSRTAERAKEIFYEETKKLREQIRKETASDILRDISKSIKVKEDIYGLEYHIIIGKEEVFELKKKLKEKYGVEVDE